MVLLRASKGRDQIRVNNHAADETADKNIDRTDDETTRR